MKIPEVVLSLPTRELLDMAYMQLGKRVHPGAEPIQILDLLRYKHPEIAIPDNPVNAMRVKIIDFIERHENQLSLPCHGDCFQHCDAMVVQCYIELQQDTQLHVSLEDLSIATDQEERQ